jgi:hypothetical protein
MTAGLRLRISPPIEGSKFTHQTSPLFIDTISACRFGPFQSFSLTSTVERSRSSDKYGWSWSDNGQHFCRTFVAECKIRGGIYSGLPRRNRGAGESGALFQVLQRRTPASGAGQLHSGRGILGSELRDCVPAPFPHGGGEGRPQIGGEKNIEFTPYFAP